MSLIPRNIEVYAHGQFVGGKAIRFRWRGWNEAFALLRRDERLDPPIGPRKVRHPRWVGGWSWTTRRGIVARCRYRGPA